MSRLRLTGLAVVLLVLCAGCRQQASTSQGWFAPTPELVSDIGAVSKIEVVAFVKGSTVGGPVQPKGTPFVGVVGALDRKSHPKEFASATSELSAMLSKTGMNTPAGLAPRMWLRIYPAGKPYVYYCKLDTRHRYFEIYWRDSHPKDPEFEEGGEVHVVPDVTDGFIDALAASVPSKVRARLFR